MDQTQATLATVRNLEQSIRMLEASAQLLLANLKDMQGQAKSLRSLLETQVGNNKRHD